jgi:hypothetical protein
MPNPTVATIAKLFCPLRAEREPTALSIALTTAITTGGGAGRLSGLLLAQSVHPICSDTTAKFQHQLTESSQFEEVITRTSGTIGQAIVAMCERSGLLYAEAVEIAQAHEGWIGPITYHNYWADSGRVAGDLTMYTY